MTRPPKAQGELVEIRFLLEASLHGLVVAKPWGDNLPFDFLVGREGRYWRVQVKSTRQRHCRGYHLSCFRPGKREAYAADEIDFLVAYVEPEQRWYVIPQKACGKRKTLVLFPSQPHNHGQFEGFREAWHLLEP